jgi:hypothetical protein
MIRIDIRWRGLICRRVCGWSFCVTAVFLGDGRGGGSWAIGIFRLGFGFMSCGVLVSFIYVIALFILCSVIAHFP